MASDKQFGAGCKPNFKQKCKEYEFLSSSEIQQQLFKNGNVDQERQICHIQRAAIGQKKNLIKRVAVSGSQSQQQVKKDTKDYQTQNLEDDNLLTNYHLEKFKNVYSLVGSNWTQILRILNKDHQLFLGSSTDELKNLFFNSIRKVAKLFQNEHSKSRKRMVKNAKNYLLSMLEIINQTDRAMLQNGLKPNPQSFMQKFKSSILSLCFDRGEWSQEVISELFQVTRHLGKKMKCFGIFKVKNKKTWKLTKQSFTKMMQFDRITLKDLESQNDSFDSESLIAHDEQLNRDWMERSLPNQEIKMRLIEQEKEEVEDFGSLNLVCDQRKPFIFFLGRDFE